MNKYRVCKLVASYRCWCHCLKHEWMYSYNTFLNDYETYHCAIKTQA